MSAPGTKLLINVDPDGYQSIASRDDFLMLNVADEEPGVVIRYCKDSLSAQISKLTEEGKLKPGDTVILDSLSSLARNALIDAVGRKIGGSKTFTPTMEAPGLSAYGARGENTVMTVQRLLKVTGKHGLNCFFTAHLDEPKTNKEGDYLYESMSLTAKAVNPIALAISEIWYMYENNKKRMIMVRAARGKQPVGSRIFTMQGEAEFEVRYDPLKDNSQPHSITSWFNQWMEGGKLKLPLPK